jgi:hypothetical protein
VRIKKSHAVKAIRLCEKQISLHTNHSSKSIFCPLAHCLQVAHMHVPGVVYLMKRSEWGLAAWCLDSWWCAPLWTLEGGSFLIKSTRFPALDFGLGTNCPCRICPRLSAKTGLLPLWFYTHSWLDDGAVRRTPKLDERVRQAQAHAAASTPGARARRVWRAHAHGPLPRLSGAPERSKPPRQCT